MSEERRVRSMTASLDLAKTEELRKAEENVARVRDGRGAVHFG
jgi:hypothetical protein